MSATSRSRREARERALELLYESHSKSETPATVIAALPIQPDPYAAKLANGVEEHRAELDDLIRKHVRKWSIERLPVLDRAVLQLAIYELLHEPEIPTAVAINEAVDLAKQFSTDESGRFVNGMLSAIARVVRGDDGRRGEAAAAGLDVEAMGGTDVQAMGDPVAGVTADDENLDSASGDGAAPEGGDGDPAGSAHPAP